MSNKWLYNIRHVNAGEPVQASIVNRPDAALETRTNYLKDRLDAAALGQALFDIDARVADNVLEGQPVFWNHQTQQYEQAIVGVETDPETQNLVPQPSSDCLGVVYRKKMNNLADIVLRGIVKLPNINNAITGPVLPGRYYLSATQPGKITKQRPSAPVSVCYIQGAKDNCAADPWIVVMPQMYDFLSDHTHYRFELVAQPAGTVTTVNGRVSIAVGEELDVNAAPGWLPADHESFSGKAPSNAVFGYNLKAHAALSQVWPPMPMMAVAMLWDKGANHTGAFEIPLGQDGLAVCDTNGIWWMSNCVNDVPWPAAQTSSASTGVECPRDERMRVIVTFLRMLFGNDRNVVTSLYADPAGPIQITNCNNEAATTGDLKIELLLQLLVEANDVPGGKALKEITTDNKFRRGWLTEGVFSTNDAIVLTSTQQTTRALSSTESNALGTGNSISIHQGLIRIDFNDPSLFKEISPQIIRLSDVIERLYYDIPYLAFPAGQESSVRLRFNVPVTGLSDNLDMYVTAQLLSRGNGSGGLPPLTVTYRRLEQPAAGTAIPLNKTENNEGLTLTYNTSITPDTVVETNTGSFCIKPGETVLVTIKREAPPEPVTYTSEIGLLRVFGVITPTTSSCSSN